MSCCRNSCEPCGTMGTRKNCSPTYVTSAPKTCRAHHKLRQLEWTHTRALVVVRSDLEQSRHSRPDRPALGGSAQARKIQTACPYQPGKIQQVGEANVEMAIHSLQSCERDLFLRSRDAKVKSDPSRARRWFAPSGRGGRLAHRSGRGSLRGSQLIVAVPEFGNSICVPIDRPSSEAAGRLAVRYASRGQCRLHVAAIKRSRSLPISGQ